MFNAPRPAQRYPSTSANAGFGGSFVNENPLGGSMYDDGLDPWSAAPSPSPPPMPSAPSLFSSVIGKVAVSLVS
jgi:sorting nexin-8